jgi:hypothetical protein
MVFTGYYPIRDRTVPLERDASEITKLTVTTLVDGPGNRQEWTQHGSLWLTCGSLRLESTGDPDHTDSWVWDIPDGANGAMVIEADWLESLDLGRLEVMAFLK